MIEKEKIFLGFKILDVPLREVVAKISADREIKPDCKIVVTPNVDHFSRLCGNKLSNDFSDTYQVADIILCDSRIIRILSYITPNRLSNVVPGSDLTKELLQQKWMRSERVCVIGTSLEEFRLVATSFKLCEAFHYNPPMGFIHLESEVSKCIDFIFSCQPSYVFLAVGSPQQEVLAKKIKDLYILKENSIRYVFCVGASLDFLSGKTVRAPLWIQKLSLEWLHRALSEPRRMVPRYFKNAGWLFQFVFSVLFKKWR